MYCNVSNVQLKEVFNGVEKCNGNQRILWIDIAKGILILLMVIGHSTGLFNQFIYQFHMGAFFILSGYVTNFDKRGIFATIVNKILTLYVPLLFIMVIIWTINYGFIKFDVYKYLYSESSVFLSFKDTFRNFFTDGSIYIWWLGACWFIVQLFFISILSKFVYEIVLRSKKILALISFLLFLTSYSVALNVQFLKIFTFCQFFFVFGFLVKSANLIELVKNKLRFFSLILLPISLVFFHYFSLNHYSMDIVSNRYNNWYIDISLVINGFVLTVVLSIIIEKVKYVSSLFIYVGKNTLAIIFFHFAYFKIAFLLLYAFDIVDITYLTNFVPTTDIGNKWWWFISLISISLSLLTWFALTKIKVLSAFLGKNSNMLEIAENKVSCLMNKIKDLSPLKFVFVFYQFYKNSLAEYKKTLFAIGYVRNVFNILLFIVLICTLFLFSMVSTTKDLSEIKLDKHGDNFIDIVFPLENNKKDIISFDRGWLPQTPSENYRWIQKESQITLGKGDYNKVIIQGFIPSNVEGMTLFKVFLNNEKVLENSIYPNSMLSIEVDTSSCADGCVLSVILDGERIPKENEADQRTFSALVSKIEIRGM